MIVKDVVIGELSGDLECILEAQPIFDSVHRFVCIIADRYRHLISLIIIFQWRAI